MEKVIKYQKNKINHLFHSKKVAKKEVSKLNSMIDELNQSQIYDESFYQDHMNTSLNQSIN